jgi:hypothetical protein
MASPLNGRVKRLEASAGMGETRYYASMPELVNDGEWLEIARHRDTINIIYELKPLGPKSYVRRSSEQIRRGTLKAAIAERTGKQPIGKSRPQFWVCSDYKQADELVGDLETAGAYLHAFIFTDIGDEMRLGPGRHRADQ